MGIIARGPARTPTSPEILSRASGRAIGLGKRHTIRGNPQHPLSQLLMSSDITGTNSGTVTVTVTGTNDAPVVEAVSADTSEMNIDDATRRSLHHARQHGRLRQGQPLGLPVEIMGRAGARACLRAPPEAG